MSRRREEKEGKEEAGEGMKICENSANTDMGFMHILIFLTISVLLDQPFYHLFTRWISISCLLHILFDHDMQYKHTQYVIISYTSHVPL